MQAKFGWHFENLAYTPDCLDTADAERIRNDGVMRQLLDEEMETLKVRKTTLNIIAVDPLMDTANIFLQLAVPLLCRL